MIDDAEALREIRAILAGHPCSKCTRMSGALDYIENESHEVEMKIADGRPQPYAWKELRNYIQRIRDSGEEP